MTTDSQAAKVAPDAASVPMLVDEKSADTGGIPVPAGMPIIGKVVHFAYACVASGSAEEFRRN
jgi:hypothetical protein